jgi:prefoldin subunit 5
MFGFKKRHAELTTAITHLSESIAGLHTRLNVLDRRIEQTHGLIAGASRDNRNVADVVLAAIADHGRQIEGLKDEHANVRLAMTHVRHSVDTLHNPVTPVREVPRRG